MSSTVPVAGTDVDPGMVAVRAAGPAAGYVQVTVAAPGSGRGGRAA
ncbi:hypothetical protein YT1_2680 [Rhodococcus ruber]|nr:hypothetical protein YT1_2680 [Rhodococcus ruber]